MWNAARLACFRAGSLITRKMNMVGMGVAVVVILIIGGVGVWYWLKIKETGRDNAHEDRTPPGIKQEPILGEDIPGPSDAEAEFKPKPKPPVAVEPEPPASSHELEVSGESADSEGELEREGEENLEESQDKTPDFGEVDDSGLPKYDPFVTEFVRINFKKPVTGVQLAPFVKGAMDIKPRGLVRILALESTSNRWFEPDAIGMFSAVAFYIKLASGQASFDKVSLSSLYQLVLLRLELSFESSSEMKDIGQMITRAEQLKTLIKNFGVQVTLLLRPLEPVPVEEFEKEAMLLGLKKRSSKHYEKIGELVLDKNGKRLGNRKGTIELRWLDERNIAISLNVPLISPENDPLRLLMSSANAFAAVFDAKIVEPSGREISGATVALLGRELDRFYKQMRENDIEPGSVRSHLLLD